MKNPVPRIAAKATSTLRQMTQTPTASTLTHHAGRHLMTGVAAAVTAATAKRRPSQRFLAVALGATASASLAHRIIENHHRRRLCEHCASTMPLDAPDKARRSAPAFRALHWLMESSTHHAIETAATAATVGLLGRHYPRAGVAALCAYAAGKCAVVVRHTDLSPWCPYCGDGYDADTAIDETPAPILVG